MRILVISKELDGASLCHRLTQEGNEVRLTVQDRGYADTLQGIVDQVPVLEDGIAWVGKTGLVVVDCVGFGELQNDLRAQGYSVVGGSAGGDRLEEDRPYCQRVLADCGVPTLPTAHFPTATAAIEHVRRQPGPWVIKQNGHSESTICYVGRLNDGADVIDLLRHYNQQYGDNGGYV